MNLSNKSQNVKIIIKAIEKETSIKQHIYNKWSVSKEKKSKTIHCNVQRKPMATDKRTSFPQG